jgi:hypothetical protein
MWGTDISSSIIELVVTVTGRYLICDIPRFVAKITIGANVDSNARFKKVKHSISNICTLYITPRKAPELPHL